MERHSVKRKWRILVFFAVIFITFLPAGNASAAAKYPSKPVQIIVARGTGGSSDTGRGAFSLTCRRLSAFRSSLTTSLVRAGSSARIKSTTAPPTAI